MHQRIGGPDVLIAREDGQVGVAIQHLESRLGVAVNGGLPFPMASTFKLPVLVDLLFPVRRDGSAWRRYFRPIIKEVVERYLDCGNPRSGFARVRCADCRAEYLLSFSCKTRGFCPSCHAKRLAEWGEWVREKLLLDVPHRQIVFLP